MGETQGINVSIAMCTHNEERDLPECLASLRKQTYKRFEVVIVDDGSSDGTARIIDEYSKHLLIKSIKVSTMPLRPARRISVEKATGGIIITVDADTILDSKCIEKIVEKFHDEKVAAAGGNVKVYGKGHFAEGVRILNTYFVSRRKKPDGQIGWITGCCAAYRRSVLERVGGLREDDVGEDVEISWRLQKLGWKVVLADDAVVYHKVRVDPKGIFEKNIEIGRRAVHTFAAHKDKLRSLNFWLRFYPIALVPLVALHPYVPLLIFLMSTFIFYVTLGKISSSVRVRTYAFAVLLVMNIGWFIGFLTELTIQMITKTGLRSSQN